MAVAGYGEAMTIVVLLAGTAAVIVALAGYVAWRGRHGRGSFLHPSVSRDALIEAERQSNHTRMRGAPTIGNRLLGPDRRHLRGSHAPKDHT